MLGTIKHCTFCNAISCKMSLFHKDKTLWKKVWEGFRDACVVQISFIEFLKVHMTSTLWTETQTTTEYYKTSSCIKLDTSLYRACWPLSFFFQHSIFCTVYVWTSSQATVRSPHGKISPKMGFPVVVTMRTRFTITQIHRWHHTEPGTVWTSQS